MKQGHVSKEGVPDHSHPPCIASATPRGLIEVSVSEAVTKWNLISLS
jgi:hypothetical protein